MNLDRLRALLPEEIHGDLERLAADYAATGLPAEPTEFVTWLHLSGRLTAVGLRDALSSVDVSVTLSEPGPDERQIALPEGTHRHRYLGLLGKGAMGEVHIARDQTLHRNVAIKKMIPRFAKHRVGNARFQTEVQITAQLDHPSIVPVYTFERADDGLPAYSMKLVRGKTLAEYLAEARAAYEKGGPGAAHALPARLEVFLQICNAMAYAHSRGVIHRDLKPDNVMIGAFHEVIVMDWGIAKLIGGGELPVDGLGDAASVAGHAMPAVTTIGAAVGTPSYMSPEQAQGRNPELTPASDQFALGLLLFEIVSLKRAYVGSTGPDVLVKAAHRRREPLVHLSPRERIPRELAAIVDKATSYEPADRYADVAALADDVRRYLRDEEVMAAPDRGFQRLARWVSHHRELALTLGFALVLLVVVGAFGALIAMDRVAQQQRQAARAHEARLQELVSTVSIHAHTIDSEFLEYEGLLEGLAQAGNVMMARPVDPAPYWTPADIAAGNGPPDLAPAPYYKADRVSLAVPDVYTSPGVDPKAIEGRIHQISALRPQLWEVMRRSVPGSADLSDAEIEAQVRTRGAPVLWSYIATNEGLLMGLPGVWRYTEGFDVVDNDWYPDAMKAPGPTWFPAGLDESGMGLLVTCVRRIDGPRGEPVGLAALDVGIAYIQANLLEPKGLRAPVEAYLVGHDGEIMAQSSLKVYQEEPKPFPHVDLLDRVRAGERIGRIERYEPAGGKLVAWATLDQMGWTYLVMGDGPALLGEP